MHHLIATTDKLFQLWTCGWIVVGLIGCGYACVCVCVYKGGPVIIRAVLRVVRHNGDTKYAINTVMIAHGKNKIVTLASICLHDCPYYRKIL